MNPGQCSSYSLEWAATYVHKMKWAEIRLHTITVSDIVTGSIDIRVRENLCLGIFAHCRCSSTEDVNSISAAPVLSRE